MTLHRVPRSRPILSCATGASDHLGPSLIQLVSMTGAFLVPCAGTFTASGALNAISILWRNIGIIPLSRGNVRAQAHSGGR